MTRLHDGNFLEFLKGKPKGKATMRVISGDEEARNFAMQSYAALRTAGWKTFMPSIIAEKVDKPSLPSSVLPFGPFLDATRGLYHPMGVVLRYSPQSIAVDDSTAPGALWKALADANLIGGGNPDSSMAKDDVLIIIGARQQIADALKRRCTKHILTGPSTALLRRRAQDDRVLRAVYLDKQYASPTIWRRSPAGRGASNQGPRR